MFSRGKKEEKKTQNPGADVPTVKLQNGVELPVVSMGTAFGDWTGTDATKGFRPEKAWRALTLAEKSGFRCFDAAYTYCTGRHLGDVVGKQMAKGKVVREDLFLTMKLGHPKMPEPHIKVPHNRMWNPRDVDITQRLGEDMDNALNEVGVGYFDLVLLHWPGSVEEQDDEFARKARKEMWEKLEEFLKNGTAKAIGVCNFNNTHLTQLMEDCTIKPMVNQLELHPYCQQPDIVAFCNDHDITVSAYSPFASGKFDIFTDPNLEKIAKRTHKHVAQVILRWHIQQGRVVAPKSSLQKHLENNLDIFNFKLSEAEMSSIAELQPEGLEARRLCPDPLRIV